MTTQKPELLPDEIWVWKPEILYGEFTGSSHPHKSPAVQYTRTDIYTAACAERDALRDFQAEIVRVYFDPTISEIETQAAIHRMMTEAKDRVSQHEKHKAGE